MKLANVKTRREVIELALRRFVHIGKQKKLLDLHGTGGVRKGYDHKKVRARQRLGELRKSAKVGDLMAPIDSDWGVPSGRPRPTKR